MGVTSGISTFLLQLGLCVFVIALGLAVYYILHDPYAWTTLDVQSKFIPAGLVPISLPFVLKPAIFTEQCNMFRTFINSLNEMKVSWWLTRETLLYTMNHKELVPWNDVITLAVVEEDMQKLKDIQTQLAQKESLYTLNLDHKPRLVKRNAAEFPVIYIEVCTKCASSSSPYLTVGGQLMGTQTFPESDIFPLLTLVTNEYIVSIPNETAKILEIQFGSNWTSYIPQQNYILHLYNTYSRQHFNHKVRPFIPYLCGSM